MKILPDDDRGETLVESLTSIMFIGVAVMGILTALGMAMFQSSLYERKSDALAELRDQAEGLSYVTCAAPADYQSAGVTVESLLYWDPTTSTYVADRPAGCATSPQTDTGAQQLTLKLDVAAAESGKAPATSTLTVVVRRP